MERTEGLSYRMEEGEGTPLIFVHGWLGSKQSWLGVEKLLDIDNPLVFYDQRCHGESKCSKFDFETLADDLHALIEELDLDDPLIVGHSMGGMVALTYATMYDAFSGLFLLGTCASTPDPENYSVRFFLEKFGSMDRRAWAIEIVNNYAKNTELEGAKDLARRELIEADDTEIIYALGAMISYDVQDEITGIEEPAAVVAGDKDGAITQEKSEKLAELLDCNLHELDATHLMLQEKPGEVAGLVEEFIETEIK